MSVRLTWSGLEELKAALRRLPADLRDDARPIVSKAATETRDLTIANYPEVTGALRRGVRLTEDASTFGITAIVKSTARHAYLYEYGTRHSAPAPPEKRLGTHAARERRKMYAALADLLRAHGLEVSGYV